MKRRFLLVGAILQIAAGWQGRAATLRADYQLNGTLGSSVAGAPALQSLGPNTFGNALVDGIEKPVLNFAANDGVSVNTLGWLPGSQTFSVVLLFKFDTTVGYRRVLDFRDNTDDKGLYNFNGALVFYPTATSPGGSAIQAGSYVQVVYTRDASQVITGYANGSQQFTVSDSTGDGAVGGGNTLTVFRDDVAFAGEASSGSVARIRVYDGALTAAEVAALDRVPGIGLTSTIQLSSNAYPFPEGTGIAHIAVTRSSPTAGPASVQWLVIGGTANPASDYTGTGGVINFAAGETMQALQIPIVQDLEYEGDESIEIALSQPSGASLGQPSMAIVMITNDDVFVPPAVIQFGNAAGYTDAENSGSAMISVARTGDLSQPASVQIGTADGTATSGLDYSGPSQTLLFAPGQSVQTYSIQIVDDPIPESDETVVIQLSNPMGAVINGSTTSQLTITDNDLGPLTYSISGTVASIVGVPLADAAVSLTGDDTQTVFTDVNGSYTLSDLPTGSYSVRAHLEGFVISPTATDFTPLAGSSMANFTGFPSVTPATVSFLEPQMTILERFGQVTFDVARTGDLTGTSTVTAEIVPDTAVPGVDYTISSPTVTLTFAPGESLKSITVPVINDSDTESDEGFHCGLKNPVNVTIGTPTTSTATIVDDDRELPKIDIECTASSAILTWPSRFDDFILEGTASLNSPTWQPLPYPVQVIGLQARVVVPKQGREEYFHLIAKADPVPQPPEVDIDVDTNRDGKVDGDDETDEDKPVKFLEDKGALVLVNCDADRTDRKPGDGLRDMDDLKISGANDEADMSPISLELKRDLTADEALWLSIYSIDDNGKPNKDTPLAVRVMDKTLKTALFRDGLGSQLNNVNLSDGTKLFPGSKKKRYDDRFLLEGFRFAMEVQLELFIYDNKNKKPVSGDTVRVLIAPFLVNHHLQPLADTKAWDLAGNLVNSNSYPFGKDYGSKLVKKGAGFQFVQDGVEWGYQVRRQIPAANSRTMITALHLHSENDDNHPKSFVNTKVGIYGWGAKDEDYFDTTDGDQGGNVECLPPNADHPFGQIIHGDRMSKKLKEFLYGQRAQYGMECRTDSMTLSHIDEVLVVVPRKDDWVTIVPDWTAGRAIMAAQNRNTDVGTLRVASPDHTKLFKTYGEILDYIDSDAGGKAWAKKLKDGFEAIAKQLTDEKYPILRMPGMSFVTSTSVYFQRGWPRNIANCQVVNPKAGDPGTLTVSEPPKQGQANDPFLTKWQALFKTEKITIGLENMDAAWIKGGESHCSSNGIREPMKK